MFTANPTPVKATDIWALGASIYELATGEMPFCGQGGVMELHGAELPVLPPPFSPELTGLMHKCLAKETWATVRWPHRFTKSLSAKSTLLRATAALTTTAATKR